MRLSNVKISVRLGLGFFVIILSMVLLTAFGISRVGEIDTRLATINDQNAVKQRYAINFRGSVHDRSIALRDVVLSQTPADLAQEVALIDKLAKDYAASATKMDAIFADPASVSDEERAALADIKRIEAETMPIVEQVVAL